MKPRKASLLLTVLIALPFLWVGCADDDNGGPPTEPGEPTYVGSATCMTSGCHAEIGTVVEASGHPHKLTPVENGEKPGDPLILPDNPPAGLSWSDVKYVIGGYGWKARFVGQDDQVVVGESVQYNIPTDQYPEEEWVDYHVGKPTTYNYSCFRCHTTGADETSNTFAEPGVTCEACHGPGSNHAASPSDDNIDVDDSSELCGGCHYRDSGKTRILASGGFIRHHEQYEEMNHAGHSALKCGSCHDYHKGTKRGQTGGIVAECTSCHSSVVLNSPHGSVDCTTCHMPYASKSARKANKYEGDVRTHIFAINDGPEDQSQMFEADGDDTIVKDGWGVTLDFVCYQCHTDEEGIGGGTAPQKTLAELATMAENIHATTPELGYVGSATCQPCHSTIYDDVEASGHPHKLTPIENGEKPGDPLILPDNPPAGLSWSEIKYVIGGYGWKARFVGLDDQVVVGEDVQYNIPTDQYPEEEWVDYHVGKPTTYNYSCFRCHTTGPDETTDTFAEPGINCEACHGPGNQHATSPSSDNIEVDDSSELCGGCHYRDSGKTRILTSGGFIRHHEQYEELNHAGHSALKCGSCHDPHKGTKRGQTDGVEVECTSCHGTVEVGAPHDTVDCTTCHMPYASKSARKANKYEGDIRTHIFAINEGPEDQSQMFETDGDDTIIKDGWGVTLDFVCYQCHTDEEGIGGGTAPQKTLVELAAEVPEIHP